MDDGTWAGRRESAPIVTGGKKVGKCFGSLIKGRVANGSSAIMLCFYLAKLWNLVQNKVINVLFYSYYGTTRIGFPNCHYLYSVCFPTNSFKCFGSSIKRRTAKNTNGMWSSCRQNEQNLPQMAKNVVFLKVTTVLFESELLITHNSRSL